MNDLTDQQLNTLCCKALGWKIFESPQLASLPDGRYLKLDKLNFCQSLDLIQQYLVPHLDQQELRSKFRIALERWFYDNKGMVLSFDVINAPARVRVLAFLQAMGMEG